MAARSTNIDFATLILTVTPRTSGATPLTFTSSEVMNEQEILGEVQLKKERGERYMAADGETSTTVHNYAKNGQRDLTIMDGEAAETLLGYFQQNPTVHFDLDVQYTRVEQDASTVRIQRHRNCFIRNSAVRVISPEVVTNKFTIDFEWHGLIDASTGQLVGA